MVTGGSRGIGAAIVSRLANDGAVVAFTYSSSHDKAAALVEKIRSDGQKVHAINADSADPEAVIQSITQTVEQFGKLDILVNNAGIYLGGTVDEFSLSDFDQMVAINMRAVFVAVQAALKHMGSGSRIITIGSIGAERTGSPGNAVYSMTKGAIAALNRGFARDLGPRGITANVVQPGPTETDMMPEKIVGERMRSLVALQRMGRDTEIASLVAYVASPESSFITGSTLTIDGGYLA